MVSINEDFSRERLTGYQPELLAAATVLIVGIGALGQNVALNLALAGVGEIRIVDPDQFETHNRTRSPLFPLPEEQHKLGLGKARAVAHKLRPLMTVARPVVRNAAAYIQALGDGAFKDVSAILACVDKPSARAYLSDKARLHSIPLVEGGFDGAEISLSCFPGVRGDEARTAPCWQCSHQNTEVEGGLFSCQAYARRVDALGFVPAIQNAAATLAGLQAEAAILTLHEQLPSPLHFRAIDLNIRTGQSNLIKLSTDPLCPGIHSSLATAPLKLQTAPDQDVEQLLTEVGQLLSGPPRIEFASPLVWTANCRECGRMVCVQRPMWDWAINRRCQLCEGPFPLAAGDIPTAPVIYYYVDLESDQELLKSNCGDIGFPALALVKASLPKNPPEFFEMAGSLEHLYELGENNGQS